MKPIPFSTPMIRAILSGRKAMTRRLVTVPWIGHVRSLPYEPWYVEEDGRLLVDCSDAHDSCGNGDYREYASCMPCPYGAPGDQLWIRETWAEYPSDGDYIYRATTESELAERLTWRPSVHMSRRMSRITLDVTTVRVERLQDITEEDAIAEGVELYHRASEEGEPGCTVPARYRFRALWDSINGKRAPWGSNPWVWVVGFKRVQS